MTTQEKIIRNKLSLRELAEYLKKECIGSLKDHWCIEPAFFRHPESRQGRRSGGPWGKETILNEFLPDCVLEKDLR
jgi:hypothetical protein